MVVSVFAILPQLIQSSTSDYQSRINFDTIWSEIWILEKLLETLQISFHAHVWQIWHHVSNNFVCTILGQCKGLFYSLDGMSSVGVSRNIFVNRLNTNLNSGTSVRQHIRKVSFLAEIRSGFDGDSDTFLLALFRKLDGFLDIGRNMSTECIMKISDEIIPIFFIQRHESSTHHNELNFINIMSNFF